VITDRDREEMVNVMVSAGPFAYGKDTAITATADEWLEAGFTPQDAHDWLHIAKCFDVRAAVQLREAGIDSDMAASKVDGQAIGARVSAKRMTIDEAKTLTDPLKAQLRDWI